MGLGAVASSRRPSPNNLKAKKLLQQRTTKWPHSFMFQYPPSHLNTRRSSVSSCRFLWLSVAFCFFLWLLVASCGLLRLFVASSCTSQSVESVPDCPNLSPVVPDCPILSHFVPATTFSLRKCSDAQNSFLL